KITTRRPESKTSRETPRGASLLPQRLSCLCRLSSPPPHAWECLLARPHLIQRLALIQPPIFHHISNCIRVVDVLERIGIQHDQIVELARLERPEILLEPNRVRSIPRRHPQPLPRLHAPRRHRPHRPMAADPAHLPPASPPL